MLFSHSVLIIVVNDKIRTVKKVTIILTASCKD